MLNMLHTMLKAGACLLLLFIGVEDARTGLIRNRSNLLLFILAFADCLVTGGADLGGRVSGAFIVSGFLFLVSVASRGGIGGGDIKLAGAAGFLLGLTGVLTGTWAGMFAAGIYSILLLTLGRRDRKDSFPLGPFLCGGYILALFL